MVDNASSDGSADYVKLNYPWIRVIELDRNYGFARANNIGVEHAKGEYVVFLNNDTVVTPAWLDPLVYAMEKDRGIGIAGSKILLHDTPEKINSAGAHIILTGGGFDIGFMDDDYDKYNNAGRRGCVCAATMIVRRDEFLNFGGFDEDYFMYFEDVDLCWRYWLYGKKVEYIPGSVVYHKFGGTSGKQRHTPIRVFYGTRNALFNIIKNYEIRNILIAIAVSIPYDILKTVYFLARLEVVPAFSMIKAYFSFIKHLRGTLKKRAEVQRNREVRDSFLFNNSIILPISAAFKEFIRLLKM
jgi:GT2 family glycosyltransferase